MQVGPCVVICLTASLLSHLFFHDGNDFTLQHYNVELKDNSVNLTEEGVALAEMVLETNDLWDENDPWARCMISFFNFI